MYRRKRERNSWMIENLFFANRSERMFYHAICTGWNGPQGYGWAELQLPHRTSHKIFVHINEIKGGYANLQIGDEIECELVIKSRKQGRIEAINAVIIVRQESGNNRIRDKLEPYEEGRWTFVAEYVRTSYKTEKKRESEKTILLKNVKILKDDNKRVDVTDHIWMSVGKRFREIMPGLKRGYEIQLDAKVRRYKKGGMNSGKEIKIDYRLCYPSKLKILTKEMENLLNGNDDD